MISRVVKRVEVVYEDGTVEAYETTQNACHITRQNYDKGAKTPEEGWTQHEIRWTEGK